MSRTIVTGVLLCASALAGCAFFGKSEPLAPHYYSADTGDTGAAQAAPRDEGLALRLGSVLSASHLRQHIAYRRSERGLSFYQERRWAERPEMYLERALVRALFQEGGAAQVVSGPAPTLTVELLEFVELREPLPFTLELPGRSATPLSRRPHALSLPSVVGDAAPLEGEGVSPRNSKNAVSSNKRLPKR